MSEGNFEFMGTEEDRQKIIDYAAKQASGVDDQGRQTHLFGFPVTYDPGPPPPTGNRRQRRASRAN